jgi:hypothetical protein
MSLGARKKPIETQSLSQFGVPFDGRIRHPLAPGNFIRQRLADAVDLVVVATARKAEEFEIDKSELTIGELRRHRDRVHLRFVASQPCLVCGRSPADAHHLRFAQPRAMGRKTSDEFVVPLCRTHHRQNHQLGDERAWWNVIAINPLLVAERLWQVSRGIIT